jgi:predicted dehydrogenase
VLCEKPTARDAAEAEEMLAAAQARPRQLALIDHELRFLPAIIRARQLLADGAIGSVRHALFRVIGNSRADLSRPWNWWSDAARGGGALGAYGSHQIDLLRFLLQSEVAEVAATLHTFIGERPAENGLRPVTSDDYYSLRLRFANGALATIECSAVARTQEPNSLTLYGAGGSLRWLGGALHHAEASSDFRDITPTATHALPAGLQGDFPHGTVYLAHALSSYLRGDAGALALGATFADGLSNQRVLDAARESERQGGRYIAL